jgi:hypothetical protein
LEFSIDPERKIIPALDKLRRKRNVGACDDYGLVSQNEADTCGKMAVRVRKNIEDWIRRNYRDKLRSGGGVLNYTESFRRALWS